MGEYERWRVSGRGTVAHLWTHRDGTSRTLCGRPIRRDGRLAYMVDADCPKCADEAERRSA